MSGVPSHSMLPLLQRRCPQSFNLRTKVRDEVESRTHHCTDDEAERRRRQCGALSRLSLLPPPVMAANSAREEREVERAMAASMRSAAERTQRYVAARTAMQLHAVDQRLALRVVEVA